MPSMGLDVRKNKTGFLARVLPGLIDEGVKLQTIAASRSVERHIVAAGSVDTGRMLGSVRARTNGSVGIVTVEAKSDEGFPYPIANNFGWHDRGGTYHPGKHWAEQAAAESGREFPTTVRRNVETAL